MAIRRLSKLLADSKQQAKARDKKLARKNRTMQLERMEDRHLMAQFKVQIDPQPGAVLDDTTGATNKLSVAPTQIDFNFDAFGAITLPAGVVTPLQTTNYLNQFIKIRRSNFDGAFSTAANSNDVLITPGFLGIGERNTQVIMRFNEPLIDDLYQIEIAANFKNSAGKDFVTGTNPQSAKVLTTCGVIRPSRTSASRLTKV